MTYGPPLGGFCAPTRPKKSKTPESLVLKAVLHYLTICRLGKVTRNNVGMVWTGGGTGKGRPVRFGTPGQADVSVELKNDPRAVHVECKAKGGKLSPHQSAWLEAQRLRGNVCIVAFSVEDVYAGLTAAGFAVPVPGGRRKAVA